MSTYATDPNVHEGTSYETNEELTLAVSRDLAEPGRLRLDILHLARDPQIAGVGVVLERQEAEELARHLLNACQLPAVEIDVTEEVAALAHELDALPRHEQVLRLTPLVRRWRRG